MLTHAHTRTHAPTEPGFVLIGDVWFANLREERKEGRDQGAGEKARQAARKSAPRLGRSPFPPSLGSIPDPLVLPLLRAAP